MLQYFAHRILINETILNWWTETYHREDTSFPPSNIVPRFQVRDARVRHTNIFVHCFQTSQSVEFPLQNIFRYFAIYKRYLQRLMVLVSHSFHRRRSKWMKFIILRKAKKTLTHFACLGIHPLNEHDYYYYYYHCVVVYLFLHTHFCWCFQSVHEWIEDIKYESRVLLRLNMKVKCHLRYRHTILPWLWVRYVVHVCRPTKPEYNSNTYMRAETFLIFHRGRWWSQKLWVLAPASRTCQRVMIYSMTTTETRRHHFTVGNNNNNNNGRLTLHFEWETKIIKLRKKMYISFYCSDIVIWRWTSTRI